MIAIEHDKKFDVMIFTIKGESKCAEICGAITEYYKKGPLTKYTLWDHTNVGEGKHLSSEEAQKVGFYTMTFTHLRPQGLDLIVVPALVQFGLARMYQLYSEKYGDETQRARNKIFRSKQEAIEFIKQNKEIIDKPNNL